jgi:ABC-2 type transport system permease protein
MATTTPVRGESFRPQALAQFYAAKFRTALAGMLAYRGAVMIWFFSLSVWPLIQIVVWTTVADSQGGSAGGFTRGEYAAYFVILMVVNNFVFSWHMWEMGWRVQTGNFSTFLMRPIHPIHNDIVENLAFKTLTMIPLVPVALGLSFAFDAEYNWKLANMIFVWPAIAVAGLLLFVLEWTVGLAAFWMTKLNALFQLYSSFYFFLAGAFAPIELLPGPIQDLARVLPFRWMLAFPIEMALGRLDGREIAIGFGMQAFWLAVALGILRFCWARAASRYSAVGA